MRFMTGKYDIDKFRAGNWFRCHKFEPYDTETCEVIFWTNIICICLKSHVSLNFLFHSLTGSTLTSRTPSWTWRPPTQRSSNTSSQSPPTAGWWSRSFSSSSSSSSSLLSSSLEEQMSSWGEASLTGSTETTCPEKYLKDRLLYPSDSLMNAWEIWIYTDFSVPKPQTFYLNSTFQWRLKLSNRVQMK